MKQFLPKGSSNLLLLLFFFVSTNLSAQTVTEIIAAPIVGATWVVPCGVTEISVQIRGAGGGGGSASQGAGGTYGGGGGGGGGYAEAIYAVLPGQTFTYTVGTGGAGSSTGANGGSGTATVFGVMTANGGTGGASNSAPSASVAGGTGGTASGGTTNITGTNGQASSTASSGAGGGCGPLGTGGAVAITVPRTDGASGISGGGGSGGFTNQNPRWDGGNGGDGQIVISYIGANAGLDKTYPCLTASINLEGLAPVSGTGTWTKISGTGTISAPNNPTSAVTGLTSGACSVFRWTWSGAGCRSVSDDVTICIDGTANCFDEPCTADPIPVNTSCTYMTASTVGATPTVGMPEGGCGNFTAGMKDVWYSATIPATGIITFQGTDAAGGAGFLSGLAAYRGTCDNLEHAGCVSTSSTATPATLTVTGVPGEVIYLRIWNTTNVSDAFQICALTHANTVGDIAPGGNTLDCSGAASFYDPGGLGGNYLPNTTVWYEVCPNWNGTYASVTFSSLNLGAGDKIIVLNGGLDQALVIGEITSATTAPLTITSSYPLGCLQFCFLSNSDASVGSGWEASVTCSFAPGTNTGGTFYDDYNNTYVNSVNCNGLGGIFVCGDGNIGLSNDNGGVGTNILQELGVQTAGCLSENGYTGEFTNAGGNTASYWIYFQAISDGILTMSFSGPGGQNYDFAIYGPSTTYQVPCPMGTGEGPIRCSNTTNNAGGVTGFGGTATDYFENQNGDGWVAPLNVVAGETYAMLLNIVQNGSPNPIVDLDVGGTAALDCEPKLLILDVNLVSFDAVNQGSKNVLTWITASENKNDYFTVLKSSNATQWEEIGTIKGKGTTEAAHFYQFEDYLPLAPVTYYRLKFTDTDGKSGYSKVVAVKKENPAGKLFESLYPNPSENDISFDYAGTNFKDNLLVCVHNSVGQLVYCQEYKVTDGNQKITLNTTQLKNGIYQISVYQGVQHHSSKFAVCR